MTVRIFDGWTYRDATPEEIEEFNRAIAEEEEERRKQPPTDEEILSILLGGES